MLVTHEERFSEVELMAMFTVEGRTSNGRLFDLWEVKAKRAKTPSRKLVKETLETHKFRVRKLRAEVYRMFEETNEVQ